MWYIEWYSESPYELPVLYWCVRVLHVAFYSRGDAARASAVKDLFDTHGIIIMMRKDQKFTSLALERTLFISIQWNSLSITAQIAHCIQPWPKLLATLHFLLNSIRNGFI